MATARKFEDKPAIREKTPLLVGLIGPSGTGKTYSALRLATGIQRVSPGEIYVIDTEAKRALHYAENFKYRHLAFGAPFGPSDYLDAIKHCVDKGAGTIIIDSMSHEHEGAGGVLEMHAADLQKFGGGDEQNFRAWIRPKAERQKLINGILQIPCNFIFCFRAKEKIKPQKGGQPANLGWQPIAGDKFIYEMTVKCLLLPGADGVPTLKSDIKGEKEMIKVPGQFRTAITEGRQLSEDVGQALAVWAAGVASSKQMTVDEIVAGFEKCTEPVSARELGQQSRAIWAGMSKPDKERINAASKAASERIERANRSFETTTTTSAKDAETPPNIVPRAEPDEDNIDAPAA